MRLRFERSIFPERGDWYLHTHSTKHIIRKIREEGRYGRDLWFYISDLRGWFLRWIFK